MSDSMQSTESDSSQHGEDTSQNREGRGAVRKQKDASSYKTPPIVIIGTHRNHSRKHVTPEQQVREEAEKKHEISSAIKGKPYERHVIPKIYSIENNPKNRTKDDEKMIHFLRTDLTEIALQEPYMGERIPVRWLQFESVLLEQAAKKTHYITFEEARNQAAKHGITDNTEFVTVLQFMHDLGTIIYFGSNDEKGEPSLKDLVILNPQWLIDIFKTIITVKPVEKQWSTYCDRWRLLADKGILQDSLINHIWSKHLHLKDELLAIMEKFDLICPQYPDEENGEEEKAYYVPACLRHPQSAQERESGEIADGTFYLNFYEYLPDAVFNYVTIYAARWSQEKSGIPPKLFYRLGRFTVGAKHNRHSYRMEMQPARPACIKVVVERKQTYGIDEHHKAAAPSPDICEEIIHFMQRTMEELRGKWARGIRFELSVACVACRDKRQSLHLIPLTDSHQEDEEIYCEFTEDHILMGYYWKQLQRQSESTLEMSDSDFRAVIKQLDRDDLQKLYIELELQSQAVQKAEYRANTTDIELQAMEVLRMWRQEMRDKGQLATKEIILHALEECENTEAAEILEEIWK
ncbi:uncharacterized protein [Amphiura filiformis]|uniref:uncharacterized protein n=1 Tax=Amphiura filiformis TaxID=82378 RepID=UPI003B212DDD